MSLRLPKVTPTPLLFALVLLGSTASAARAQTGVSNDRVSLPSGPGSLEGIGENVGTSDAMGVMTYHVAFQVPSGFAGVTPKLGLDYSSGQGGSVVGMGFQFDTPFIERMTYRGLPEYDLDDDFAADGATQLVRLPGSDVFRARDEGEFVRYRWRAAQQGAEGYWTAEYPDGTVGYFGADRDGNVVANARVGGPDGTFRYHLVDKVDVFGHVLHYSYLKDGAVSLLSRVQYVFVEGQPAYQVTFEYEPRRDDSGFDFLLDGKGGFEEKLTQRLRTVTVFSRDTAIRRYELDYESYAASGGFTRLSRVSTYGADGGLYPAAESFAYSQALGGVCAGDDCQKPFMVDMGATGADVETGRATLVDLNGDSLPDLVFTPAAGAHEIFLSEAADDGSAHFGARSFSVTGDASFSLGGGVVQILDVDGDGRSDLLNTRSGQYLHNDGSGDWGGLRGLAVADTPDFEADFDPEEEGGQRSLRFLDYDNDKRIDIVRSTQFETLIYRNSGAQGFVSDARVEPIGMGFAEDDLDLADMNGDGLLDPVRLSAGQLTFRLNLGWGRWSETRVIDGLPVRASEVESKLARLEDINGDALCDLVVVSGSEVKFAINRNGETFLPAVSLASSDIRGEIPALVDQTVLVADMNGSGSADIVWVNRSGRVQFLELFPVRPNLISRITNGLGRVTEIQYGTSVAHLARDGGAWKHLLPHPMVVVDRVDTYDELTFLHELTEYRYHDGFYDGIDKQFRGYELTERSLLGDESQEPGRAVTRYDVGVTDRYFHGRRVYARVESGGRVLFEVTSSYGDCVLGDVPRDTALAVRFICPTAEEKVVQEGLPAERWISTRTEFEHDGYGNVVRQVEHGITAEGGKACAPCERDVHAFGQACGAACLGDERYTETSFITPGKDTNGRWVLRAPFRTRTYGRPGDGVVTEKLTFYDGEAFVGLPLGQLTLGLASRVTDAVDGSGKTLASARFRHDAHGKVVELLDPLGEPEMNGHRRTFSYDRENLRVTQTDVFLMDDGGPYQLRQRVRYEPRFDRPSSATAWLLVDGSLAPSAGRETAYLYDEFARLVALNRAGDAPSAPTEVYRYELGNPTSRIVLQRRSQSGGELDLEQVRCLDGLGRTYQTRTRVDGRYQVDGFVAFNVNGAVVRTYQPYQGPTSACDRAAPEHVLFTSTRYDATHRVLRQELPDAPLYGTASALETLYEPYLIRTYDPEDADPKSPHFATPDVAYFDGLDRNVVQARTLAPGKEERVEVRFDSLGRVRGYVDPQGHEKHQTFDLLGRIVRLQDPNTGGDATFEYDAAGNLVARRDARGVITRSEFDGLNRPVSTFEEGRENATRITRRYDRLDGCAACTLGEGNLVEASYPLGPLTGRGVERLGYDARGRVVHREVNLEGHAFVLSHAYDNANRLVRTSYPDGDDVAYTYDGASRITAVPSVLKTVRYDERGLAVEHAHENGTVTMRAYDERMRLASLRTSAPKGSTWQDFRYERDRVGNLTHMRDDATGALVAPMDRTYAYDAWYRLVSLSVGDEQVAYAHDTVDNVLSRISSLGPRSPEHQGAYTYRDDRPNAVSDLGGTRYEYDAAGNTVQRGALALHWDYLGRLTEARRADEVVGQFVYGADLERRVKIEGEHVTYYVSDDFEVRDGVATRYVRVGGARVARVENTNLAASLFEDWTGEGKIDAADAWLARNAHTDDGPALRMLASACRRLLVDARSARTFLHGDHLGSITLATDDGGAAVGQRAFYPSGAVIPGSTGFVDQYGFTGQERDASTDLLHFRHRSLDTASARWTSIDPLFSVATTEGLRHWGEATGAYGYVAGHWDNVVDPLGLKWYWAAAYHPNGHAPATPHGLHAYLRQEAVDARHTIGTGGNVAAMRVTLAGGDVFEAVALNGADGATRLGLYRRGQLREINPEEGRLFEASTNRASPRLNDTEQVLVHGMIFGTLADVAVNSGRTVESLLLGARMDIYSERPPCHSCDPMLRNFAAMFGTEVWVSSGANGAAVRYQ